MTKLVCFANPESPRVAHLRAAVEQRADVELTIVQWLDVLGRKWEPAKLPREPCWLRLESPGKNWEVEKAILLAGADETDEEDPGRTRWWRMSRNAVRDLTEDYGRILPMRQWQLGWRRTLRELALATFSSVRWLAPPEDVLCMFDKAACQTRVEEVGCPAPRMLGVPHDFDHLLEMMGKQDCPRVFLKPCHGSSASGAVALEISARGILAHTTVELLKSGSEPLMFNSRRVSKLESSDEIRPLVDAVCRLRAVAQAWFPKVGWRGQRLDLRVVVIGGEPAHVVPRLSDSPFTTLQLGAQRGDLEALKADVAPDRWQGMLEVARLAARAFPQSLHMGVDVAVSPAWSRAAVLEVNAFGDLLPGVFFEGRDTYACELAAMEKL